MIHRPRRLRKNALIREMVAETRLSKDSLVYPYFVVPGKNVQQEITAMPGIHHFSQDSLLKDVESSLEAGINKILLFGVGEEKTEDASSCYQEDSVVADAIRGLRKTFGN